MTPASRIGRAPTADQRAKERAVLVTSIADVAIVLGMILAAFATGSLTMLGEATRGGLMTAVEIYALVVLCAVHRDRLRRFRYGIGKIEQIFNLVIGLTLCVSGLWIAERMGATLLDERPAASQLGMAIAAVVNAINLLINLLGWAAMAAAGRRDDSPIYRAQRRARGVKALCSVLLQSALTMAALTGDPVIALALDAVGAAFVSGVMLVIGWRMMAECAADLLDHALAPDDKERLRGAVLAQPRLPGEHIRVRTRRCGGSAQAELILTVTSGCRCSEVKRRVAELQQAIAERLPQADVAVSVVLAPA